MKSWIAVLLVPAVLTVTYAQRPLRRPPAGSQPPPRECNETSECSQSEQCCTSPSSNIKVSYCRRVHKVYGPCNPTEGGCGCEAGLVCKNRTLPTPNPNDGRQDVGRRRGGPPPRRRPEPPRRRDPGVCLPDTTEPLETPSGDRNRSKSGGRDRQRPAGRPNQSRNSTSLQECGNDTEPACPQSLQCCPGLRNPNVSYCQNVSKLNGPCDPTEEGGCGCEAGLVCTNRTRDRDQDDGHDDHVDPTRRRPPPKWQAAGICLNISNELENTTPRCPDVCTKNQQCCPGIIDASVPSCQRPAALKKRCDPEGKRGCGCVTGLTCEEMLTKSGKKKKITKQGQLLGICREHTTK